MSRFSAFMLSALAALFIIGCGGSSEGESQLSTQQLLDNGQFDAVIAKVEPTASTNDDYLALAAAYMGRANFSFPDILAIVLDDTQVSNNAFADFAKKLSDNRTDTTLQDLSKASDYYLMVLGTTCNALTNPTDGQKDLCLFSGFSSLVKATVSLSYISDDLDAILDNADAITDDKLKATTCAMQYAIDQNATLDCTVTAGDANITFDSTITYDAITMTYNGNDFDYLLTQGTPKDVALTDGYCTTAFETCTAGTADCYVCPINRSATEDPLTTTEVLVTVLNDGFDSIESIIADLDDADLQQDIDEYKSDVDSDSSGDISASEIIDYINTQNQ